VDIVQLFQIQPYVNVRRFDDRRRWRGRGSRRLLHLFRGRFTLSTEMCPDFIGEVVIKCTGVRFLVRNSQLGQVIYNHIAFHFQFTRQFVDPNLRHA
jgi:hypothetical protein